MKKGGREEVREGGRGRKREEKRKKKRKKETKRFFWPSLGFSRKRVLVKH